METKRRGSLDGSGCFGDLVCFVEVYVGQGLKARESGE
jgi:hypothetical protein